MDIKRTLIPFSPLIHSCNEDTVTIVDVTDKQKPVQLSRVSYRGVSYTHQGWLTADHNVFIFGDEFDEKKMHGPTITYVLNVEDLRNPSLVGRHLSRLNSIDHNIYIKDGHVYSANYEGGLQVLRIGANISHTTVNNLAEVAYFNVYPEAVKADFNGAWSNYPYFPSGNVIVSSIERGLFVVSVDTSGPLPSNPGINIDGDSEDDIPNQCFTGMRCGGMK